MEQQCGPNIAIIGAGISGLTAAKQLARFDPVVFEATDTIGGVWTHCSFRSTRLQTVGPDYEFTDYPWKKPIALFPTSNDVVEYLNGYADHFDLRRFIRLNSKVVDVKFLGDRQNAGLAELWGEKGRPIASKPAWEIGVLTGHSDTVQWYKFHFVVMCIGKYGDVPRMPSYPSGKGPEVFKGKVMHSLDYCKLNEQQATELMKDKKVIVVGYKKSALDLAYECTQVNQGPDGQACTMLVRTVHWVAPHYYMWGVPFFNFYSTRFAQFLHQRPNDGLIRSIFCRLARPLKTGISKFIESYLVWKLPLDKYGLRPNHPFEEDYAACQMPMLPDHFFEEADKGKIKFAKATKWWFWEGGIMLDDGTKLDADVVFLATGYEGKNKLKSILKEPFLTEPFPGSNGAASVMPLYRGTIHPLIPHMAFVGYIESLANLHTTELRTKWLARLLEEKFWLPSVQDMFGQITREIENMKNLTRFYDRHCISTFSINHSDEICKEMGWSSWRKKGNWIAEAFCRYNNHDYAETKEIKSD